tara:strand:- start:2118 stop:3734 length:1617 start_codon:yes stop_codon:yes gene_type:complete
MAIVSISRIQIRRGKKNVGSGLPQLAGGEFGWAIDTQELFLGNASVAEGAPSVGNTKILTEHDNLFELSNQYIYLNGSVVQTGTTALDHITRTLQSRLDDLVSARSFGAVGDGGEQTSALQRAIDQLFVNPATVGNETSRVTLKLHAGVYTISQSLKLPPFTNIAGDGSDKTIIKQTGNFPIFITENGLRTPDTSGNQASTTTLNQARHISLTGMTLETAGNNAGLVLQNCINSKFEDIKITSDWSTGTSILADQIGIKLISLSTVVTNTNNSFNKIYISGFSYGAFSNYDIMNNNFSNSVFEDLGYGVVFGKDTILGNVGQATGPINNVITNSRFTNIDKTGFWVENGYGNTSSNNHYTLVGNDGGVENLPAYGVIKFSSRNNSSNGDHFARTSFLSTNTSYLTNVPYIPEIEGIYAGDLCHSMTTSIGYMPSATRVLRLPADSNKKYSVSYIYKSNVVNATRTGTINILVNLTQGTTKLEDEYDYDGDVVYNTSIEFSSVLSDENADATKETLVISAKNTTVGDNASLIFHVSVLS